jgi:hypothetical protein
MRFARVLLAAVALGLLATFILSASTSGRSAPTSSRSASSDAEVASQFVNRVQRYESLAGMWRFAMDPTDSGIKNLWFNQRLSPYQNPIRLPGILQEQRLGDEISTKTSWVLSLYDRFWYLREDYKDYLETGKVKVPFLSQPPRHYLGVAWYQRDL